MVWNLYRFSSSIYSPVCKIWHFNTVCISEHTQGRICCPGTLKDLIFYAVCNKCIFYVDYRKYGFTRYYSRVLTMAKKSILTSIGRSQNDGVLRRVHYKFVRWFCDWLFGYTTRHITLSALMLWAVHDKWESVYTFWIMWVLLARNMFPKNLTIYRCYVIIMLCISLHWRRMGVTVFQTIDESTVCSKAFSC